MAFGSRGRGSSGRVNRNYVGIGRGPFDPARHVALVAVREFSGGGELQLLTHDDGGATGPDKDSSDDRRDNCDIRAAVGLRGWIGSCNRRGAKAPGKNCSGDNSVNL